MNPVSAECGYSPYSALSSMAGNPLLLSPELLMQEGWLTEADLHNTHLAANYHIDYEAVVLLKKDLLTKAWQVAKQTQSPFQKQEFERFCQQEAYWLDDFALYTVLKEQHDGRPWHQWPESYKLRRQKPLASFRAEQAEAIRQVQWVQFVFANQWKTLKAYCHRVGIRLFGDLPFYLNYDSADVWANPTLFCLDKDGNMTHVAGVPPTSSMPRDSAGACPFFGGMN